MVYTDQVRVIRPELIVRHLYTDCFDVITSTNPRDFDDINLETKLF
jgi:hypothetical protein